VISYCSFGGCMTANTISTARTIAANGRCM
jgi:hypothetical protein